MIYLKDSGVCLTRPHNGRTLHSGMSDSLIPPDFFPNREPKPPRRFGCFAALTVIVLALILVGGGALLYLGMGVREAMEKFGVDKFFTTKATSDHREVIIEIGRTHGDVLEVASPMKTVEIFRKTDSRYAAWGWVYLGTATSEIKVPATYRFHIKLSEMKKGHIRDGVLIVETPPAQPSLPVAFDTSGVEKKTDGTWLRFDSAQQLAELEKSITPELNARATRHLTNIREVARADIEEFVQKWVVESHPSYAAEIKAIKVVFPDEPVENNTAAKEVPVP